MKVRVASHLGMCFGVRDAIDLAMGLTQRGPVTILGDLVHNPDVVAQVDAAGAIRVRQVDEVATRTVLLTAHGTADRVKLQLRLAGHEVHDATCPLVHRAHLALARLVAEGYYPAVIGQAGHVEVRGLVGDLEDCTIILEDADIDRLVERFGTGIQNNQRVKLGLVSQTTQPLERVLELVEQVRQRLPDAEVRFLDTVCQPTKDRQASLRELTQACEVVVVVGGPDSNNSRKLTELARQLGCRAYQVAGAGELKPEWFAGVESVGLTAGTSTPDRVIDEVRLWLEALNPCATSVPA